MADSRLQHTSETKNREAVDGRSDATAQPTCPAYLKDCKETAIKLLKTLNVFESDCQSLMSKIQTNKEIVSSMYEEINNKMKAQRNSEKQRGSFVTCVENGKEWFLRANNEMSFLQRQILKSQKELKAISINVLDNKSDGYVGHDEDINNNWDDDSDSDYTAGADDDGLSEYTSDFENLSDSDNSVKDEHTTKPNEKSIESKNKLQSINISSDEVNESDASYTGSTLVPKLLPNVYSTNTSRNRDAPLISNTNAVPIGESQSRTVMPLTMYNPKLTKPKHSTNILPSRIQAHASQEMIQSAKIERKQAMSIDVQSIHQLMKRSGKKLLPLREETVMNFKELLNMIPSPNDLPSLKRDMSTIGNPILTMVVCQRHNVLQRNWIDVKLFTDFYLVIIQKTATNSGSNEYLNKYNIVSGEIMAWLWLPGAGRMCKIGEDGRIGVLQIGKKERCISVVQTTRHIFNANEQELRKVYHINIEQAYTSICHLEILHPQGSEDQLKFAAVYSAERKGEIKEEIDIINSVISMTSSRMSKSVATATKIARLVGICSIDALGGDKLVISLHSNIICLDIRGRVICDMEAISRVTDICCTKDFIFACICDKGQIMQIQVCGNSWKIVNNNIIQNENIKPSQVSVCGRQVLIREFIMDKFKSEIILRVMKMQS